MKKLALTIIAAIICTMPSLCRGMDFRALEPETASRIEALRQEVREAGGTYEVCYSAAMDRELKDLAGLKVPAGWNKSDAPSVAMPDSTVQTLHSSFDWRSLNGVTPIKDQGNCGSCWAFATVGPLESEILLQDGITVDLSEQYLVSCNVDGWSCNGGWWAHDYHLNLSGQDNNGPGAVLEASAPYTSSNGTTPKCGGTYQHPYKITNWAYVGSENSVPSVDAIKQAIYTYGPIGVGVYAGPKFQAYSGGIFNTSESGSINHAVVLVGWNDDLGTDNGYWILRNSWGTSWGESGYMRIRYGVSQVGYAANFIEFGNGTPNPTPSSGSVSVPNVVGETQSAATAAITAAGLTVGTVTTQSSTTVASGSVISQSPTASTSVAQGTSINLTVSSGPPVVYKPDLTGLFLNIQTKSGGRVLSGYFQVQNVGNASSGNKFRVLLYVSKDGVSKSTSLGSAKITNSLAPGGYVNLKINKTFATSVNGKYLMAVVDPDNQVADSNRNNNVVVSNAIQKKR